LRGERRRETDGKRDRTSREIDRRKRESNREKTKGRTTERAKKRE
jgi:hypothetical protein